EHGAPVERTRLIGAISRALIADAEWPAARDLVARPELQVIVSNVTEAGFRPDAGFPARLTDLLHTPLLRLRAGPPRFAIPAELRATFAIDATPDSVIIAPDIGFYRERKLRLLNGTHTATAPLALLAGVRTVREAAEHPRLGAFLRHILFEEIVPATDLPADAAVAFAGTVIDRFRNPWLDHEWRVIAANQTAKLRLRVVPSLIGFARKRGVGGIAPQGLALGLAAYLQWARSHPAGDADLPLIERHWQSATTLR